MVAKKSGMASSSPSGFGKQSFTVLHESMNLLDLNLIAVPYQVKKLAKISLAKTDLDYCYASSSFNLCVRWP